MYCEEEFSGLEKDRSKRSNRRRARARKIKSRKRKIIQEAGYGKIKLVENEPKVINEIFVGSIWHDGRLSNNSEVNAAFGGSTRRKVNNKKCHVTYRHSRTYGPEKLWTRNAKRQIERFNRQLKEFQMEK